jgi:plasmid stabilization system protein ParE
MRLGYSQEAVHDLACLRDFIAEKNPAAAARIARRLVTGIDKLKSFPALGRPVENAPEPERIRDLFLGHYVIRYLVLAQSVLILRVWHQREDRPEAQGL